MIYENDDDRDLGTDDSTSTGASSDERATIGQGQAEFAIKGIYIRDLSFEAPHPPENVTADWAPEVKFELNTQARKLENDDYEVILKLTVTVKRDKKMAFLTEVQQAGLFTLRGFNDMQRGQMLGSFCPNVLYPYARELISNMATRGGYPPLYLAPVNFDALYTDHLNRIQQGEQAAAGQA